MRHLLGMLAAALFVLPSIAEEKKPGFELRVKSVTELTNYFEYIGGLAGQGEQGKQFAELVKAFGGKKGVFQGVDLNKPIGGYAVFTPDMVDSQFIVMLPVADEKAFVGLLQNQLSLDPKDEGDGIYKLEVPNLPPPIFFRVHEGYACFTVLDARHLKPKSLIDPKAFFAGKDDALASIQLHIDRIPPEFRKVALAQLELKLNDKSAHLKDGDASNRFSHYLATEGAMRAAICFFSEGKTLTVNFDIKPKSDDLALSATLVAKDGSDFEKVLKSLANKPALAAIAAIAENPVVSVMLNAGVPNSMKKELATRIDEVINEAAKNAGGDRETVEKILDAFAPTLKAGDYEIGVAVTGTPRDGKLRLVAASRATEGKQVEKVAREFAAFIPEDTAKFEFDLAKTDNGSIHKVAVTNDDLKRQFGSESIWFGIADNLLAIGFEAKGDATKRVASLKPGTSDILTIRAAVSRLMPLLDPSFDSKMVAETIEEVYGGEVKPGSDDVCLKVVGGSQLTVTLTVKGKAFEFLAKMDTKKKAK